MGWEGEQEEVRPLGGIKGRYACLLLFFFSGGDRGGDSLCWVDYQAPR